MASPAATVVSEAGLRPEWALQVACARTHMDPSNAHRIGALLQQGLDWDEVWRLALRHRTMPLLYRHLKADHSAAVPAETMERLRSAVQSNTVRNYRLAGQLLQAMRSLGAHGVSAVAYRGPVLAEMAYGSLAMRQFDDLDILVRKREVPQAMEALAAMGYQVDLPGNVPQSAYSRTRHHYALSRGPGQPLLELHWAIAPGYFHFPLSMDVWDRVQSSGLAGSEVLSLSAEDLLLALCVHNSTHGWGRLAWICDVAELIRALPDLDWERAMAQAQRLGGGRMVRLGLALARDVIGATLPQQVQPAVQEDAMLPELVQQVLANLTREVDLSTEASERYRLFGFHLRVQDSTRGRLRHFLRMLWVPSEEDWESLALPAALYPLYYVVRPFRLLGKHVLRGQKRGTSRQPARIRR